MVARGRRALATLPRGGRLISALTEPVYDSRRRWRPLVDDFAALHEHRELILLLLRRNLVLRYKRSVLGVGWTMLNPLLEMLVLWVVFSQRSEGVTEPFIVYLLSGVVLINLFRQGVLGISTVLINDRELVRMTHIPAVVLGAATAGALGVGFLLTLLPLLAIMLLTGVAIAPTLPLAIVPAALLLLTVTGIGLALAPAAVRFPDVLELSRVGTLLVGYMAPVFYAVTIVPERYRPLVEDNPLSRMLAAFRNALYGGGSASAGSYLLMGGCAVLAIVAGGWIYSRQIDLAVAEL